ncbi:MAG: fimbrillin family protein [Mediterranea sp.]|jgi:hypothetical protein|nr:fimbrillin family protein [Mediterranea sp.]
MKRNLCNWALAGGILLLWAACSSENNETLYSGLQPIRFAVSPAVHIDGESRAIVNDKYLPAGKSIGIFAYSYLASASSDWQSSPDLFDNKEGTVGAVPTTVGAVPTTKDVVQEVTVAGPEKYFAVRTYKHAFYSYYPYQSSVTAANKEIENDLFSDLASDKTQIDWLWDGQIDVTASGDPVKFEYSHLMSMIKIAVAKHEVNPELRMESITIGTSTSQKFKFDISTGKTTEVAGGSTSYTASFITTDLPNGKVIPSLGKDETLATEVFEQILLLPESAITSLSFKVNGENFTTPGTWAGFKTSTSGKYRLVSIVVDLSEIKIQLGGKDWINNDDDIDLIQSEVSISLGAKNWGYDPADDIDLTQPKP